MTDPEHEAYLRRTIVKLEKRRDEETDPELSAVIRLTLAEYRNRLHELERGA